MRSVIISTDYTMKKLKSVWMYCLKILFENTHDIKLNLQMKTKYYLYVWYKLSMRNVLFEGESLPKLNVCNWKTLITASFPHSNHYLVWKIMIKIASTINQSCCYVSTFVACNYINVERIVALLYVWGCVLPCFVCGCFNKM